MLGGLDAEAEHQLEMRVGGERLARRAVDRPDVDALVDRLEETRERFGRGLRARHRQC